MDICLQVLKESNKSRFDGYCVRNSVLIISHVTFRDCRVHIFPDNSCIQLFRERLSEKMHATIPKGIAGDFFTVLQRNLKEWHERPWTYVCEV